MLLRSFPVFGSVGGRRFVAMAFLALLSVANVWALNPPTFSTPRGFYSSGFQLTLAVDPADTAATLRVRYTLDGSDPTPAAGQDYAAPLSITTTSVVRAIVYDSADPSVASVSVTHSYLFPQDVVAQPANIPSASDPRFANYPSYPREFYDVGKNKTAQQDYAMDPTVVNNPAYDVAGALLAVPTVSIASDLAHMFGPDGFYDGDAEVPASMEILYPNNAAGDQQVNCSVQSHSSNRLKRSLRLSFSKTYGPSKLESALLQTTPVNPSSIETEYDTLVLRAGNNRSWARIWNPDATTYTEDEWFRDSHAAMTGVAAHGTFVHLYINGLYWGLYNITERPDESFAANYLPGKKSNQFSLKEDGRTKGDPTRWNYLVNTLLPEDMTVPANYAEMKNYLDVGLFSDYLILEWFTAVSDWPRNNWWVNIRTDSPTPARYFAWDGEWSWDRGDPFDASTHGESPHGAWVHPAFRNGSTDDSYLARFWRTLKVNRDFMITFADRVYQHTSAGGALSDIESRLRWNALNLFVEDAVIAESARWGDAITPGAPRTRDDDWNRAVSDIYALMGGNGARLITALRAQGYYPAIDPPQFTRTPGNVPPGASVALANRNSSGAIYYTTDGTDPRVSGGGVSASASLYSDPLTIDAATVVNARVLDGTVWSALAAGTFTPTATNTAPVVRAVGPTTTTLDAAIEVEARVTDDGLPAGTLDLQWSLVSGPGSVVFGTPDGRSSSAAFSTPGSYVLRFTASDGERQGSADVPVFVYPPRPAIAVESFTLINADTGTPVAGFEAMMDGTVIDLATLPTRRLNISANTNPSTVGSVRFGLDTNNNYRTESLAPYTLAGDTNGAYNPWTPALGDHTLKGTPFSGASATGSPGTALVVHFAVIDSALAADTTPPSVPAGLSADAVTATGFTLHWSAATDDNGVAGYEVFRDGVSIGTASGTSKSVGGLNPDSTYAMTVRARDAAGNWSEPSAALDVTTGSPPPLAIDSLTLIDADTDAPVPGFEALADGAVLDYSTLPTTHLNVRANSSPSTIGSVRFALNANANFRTESSAPYALAGDSAGNFNAWTPALGGYTLAATPYSGSGASGVAGPTLTIHFQVTNGTPADQMAPTVPSGLAADTVTDTGFRLTWSAATDDGGVTGYEVFRDGVSVGTTVSTNKTLTGLTANTTYAMTVRARDAAGNWSAASDPLNVQTAPPPPSMSVTSFTLIDADTDAAVPGYEEIANGAVISRASLPTTHLNVRANTTPATVGSVSIKLDSVTHVESGAPYAFFGDTAGNFKAGTIANGSHTLTAKPYSGANATGSVGTPLTISFTIE